jgi:hypothetical protein
MRGAPAGSSVAKHWHRMLTTQVLYPDTRPQRGTVGQSKCQTYVGGYGHANDEGWTRYIYEAGTSQAAARLSCIQALKTEVSGLEHIDSSARPTANCCILHPFPCRLAGRGCTSRSSVQLS